MIHEYEDKDLLNVPFYVCSEYERDIDKVRGVQDEVLLNMSVPKTIQSSFKLFRRREQFGSDPSCFTRHVICGLGNLCLGIDLKKIDADSFTCFVYHANVSRFSRFLVTLVEQDIFDPVILFCNYKRIFVDVLGFDEDAVELVNGEYRLRYSVPSVGDDDPVNHLASPVAGSITNAINYTYCNITNRDDPDLPLSRSDRMDAMMANISALIMASKKFNSLKHNGLKRALGHLLDFVASESGVFYANKDLEREEYRDKLFVVHAPLTSLFMSIPANCGTLYKKNGFS